MPHPLPEDVGGVSGTRWFLVAVPDDAAFIQAAYAIYTELTHYWKWGLEGPVPVESDAAAQLWASAVDETLEALEMGFPDILLSHIDDVEDLLRQLNDAQACCEFIPGADSVTVGGEDELSESDTDISTGTFPPGTTTETEARNYLCGAAEAFVDRLIETPAKLLTYLSWGISAVTLIVIWYTAGALIAISGIAVVGGLLTLDRVLDAIDLFANLRDLIQAGQEDEPSVVEAELSAVRDDLICSIVLADTATQAGALLRATIANAVSSVAWQNALFLFTADPFLARIFNGNSSAEPSTSCACVFDVDVLFTFDVDAEGFSASAGCQIDPPYDATNDALTVHGNTVGNSCFVRAHGDDIRTKAGLSAPAGGLQPYIMTFDFYTAETFNTNDDLTVKVNGETIDTIFGEELGSHKVGDPGRKSYTLLNVSPFSMDSGAVIAIEFGTSGGGGGSRHVVIDNLRFAGNGVVLG